MRVFHHGDWSGEAIVTWQADGQEPKEVNLPGLLLRDLSREAAVRYLTLHITRLLERL